eukprot:TRINITY_DN33618_c0_g1_i1.p1 TRINITY_DN33618_c0_g1~~TRINITY_DN33618_c0_g1_i1.p1  ORF type:complete len:652 (-),score=151.66 TRINITY_DN33618_c0_g1_i1:417-2372(-)
MAAAMAARAGPLSRSTQGQDVYLGGRMQSSAASSVSVGSYVSETAQALQASAQAARHSPLQAGDAARSLAMSQVRPAPVAGHFAHAARPDAALQQQFAPPARSKIAAPGPAAAAAAAQDDDLTGGAGNIPALSITVRYKRAWSIQDALDQHSALCRQKEILSKIGNNRVRVRQTQLQFAKLEVEDALERSRYLSPADAADAAKTQALAAHIRRASQDFSLAQRLRSVDEQVVEKHLQVAEDEMEKSRQEMKLLKLAIDDKTLVVATDDAPVDPPEDRPFRYCTNCKVGGHGQRFCEYLLKRPDWRVYPNQKWFEDEKRNEYHCPLGKRLVDFADESHFSRLAMYIKGRVWLEDKTKMWQLVPELMPETYVIEDMKWRDGREPVDVHGEVLPWFVKEADRNWGTSVVCCAKASECMELAKPGCTYVVQPHIKDPVLMEDGRKCHIKFYVLLIGMQDGKTWHLYTLKDGYLSISPNKWSPSDLSKETQVTIIRTERIGSWRHWAEAYPKCKAGVAEVVKRSVEQGKLEGRINKRQFEILSADFIVDTNGKVWLFEFNMSPVLKDPKDSPEVHDGDMIMEALDIVVPPRHETGHQNGLWDFAGEFVGQAPVPPVRDTAGTAKQSPAITGEAASSSVPESLLGHDTEAFAASVPQ